MTTHAAASSVHTQIVVDAPVERAFQVFTEDFGAFKPSEHNLLSVDIAERTSAPTGRSRPILTKPPKSRSVSLPRLRRGRASSWSIATSTVTVRAGKASALASKVIRDGRYISSGSPTC
jgi:hypothetical protein